MGASDVRAASKTYRKINNKLAKTIRVKPTHTRSPSADFEEILSVLDEKSRDRALEWYRRGLRRGYDEATTAVVEGKLKFAQGQLTCPSAIVIKADLRFNGRKRIKHSFKFAAEDLGFSE